MQQVKKGGAAIAMGCGGTAGFAQDRTTSRREGYSKSGISLSHRGLCGTFPRTADGAGGPGCVVFA